MELNGYKVSVSAIQSLFLALPSFSLRNALKAFFYLAVVISQLVQLWNIDSGALLDTCEVAIKAGLLEANGKAEERGHAVTDLCTVLDGLLVAVAIQSLQGIVLLSCSVSAQTLSVAKKKVAMVMKKASANGQIMMILGLLAGHLESNGKAEERGHAVTDLCTALDGLLVAVAIQSLQGIVLLSCNVSTQTLSVAKLMTVKHTGNGR
ncbi:hypothetical protein HKD37_12G034037 [Glycine soja]